MSLEVVFCDMFWRDLGHDVLTFGCRVPENCFGNPMVLFEKPYRVAC
jgi:hypothetical protein